MTLHCVNDLTHFTNDGFYSKADGFRTKDDAFYTKNDRFCKQPPQSPGAVSHENADLQRCHFPGKLHDGGLCLTLPGLPMMNFV